MKTPEPLDEVVEDALREGMESANRSYANSRAQDSEDGGKGDEKDAVEGSEEEGSEESSSEEV